MFWFLGLGRFFFLGWVYHFVGFTVMVVCSLDFGLKLLGFFLNAELSGNEKPHSVRNGVSKMEVVF